MNLNLALRITRGLRRFRLCQMTLRKKKLRKKAGMQRFVNYIYQQGLVIVDAAQLNNQTPKFNKGKCQDRSPVEMHSVVNRRPPMNPGEDDCSVTTVYNNAVKVLKSVPRQGNGKTNQQKMRDSSSSDEQLDTSD